MRKYADKKENLSRKKYETLQDVLKNSLLKAVAYEQALKNTNKKSA